MIPSNLPGLETPESPGARGPHTRQRDNQTHLDMVPILDVPLWCSTEVIAMRLSVTLNPDLVEEAVRVSGAHSKREAIETALKEFIRRRRLARMIGRGGKVPLALSRNDLRKTRCEE